MGAKANAGSVASGPTLDHVEVLDASDAVVRRRMGRIAREGWYGMGTFEFWFFVACVSVVPVVVSWFAVDLIGWLLMVAVTVPSAVLLRVAMVCTILRTRVFIRPGDQWYLWDPAHGRAVALVKHSAAEPLVLGLVARPRRYAADFRRLITRHARAQDPAHNFLTDS